MDSSDPGMDTIVFDETALLAENLAPPFVINAVRDFILNQPMFIDASGLAGELRIDGDSALAPNADHGMQPRRNNILIKGLSITNWDQTGIKIDTNNLGTAPADGVQVVDNFIGTDEAGTTGLGNFSVGIAVGLPLADPTRHPDQTVIEGNVIADNGTGIQVAGDATQNTTIRGNLIGTGPTGTTALGNTQGIFVSDGVDTVTIGGPLPADGNVITASDTQAIRAVGIDGDATTGVTVRNDVIGLGTDGTPLGNIGTGVSIGGDVDGTNIQANTISANGTGIALDDTATGAGAGPDNATIRSNRIGTNPAGTAVIPNIGPGVSLASVNGEGTTGTIIGGDGAPGACGGFCNVFGGTGISILHDEVTLTEIRGNHIGVNQAGTGPLAITGHGVTVTGADDVVIGTPAGPNTIGSASVAGIQFTTGVTGGTVQSNLIGVGAGGEDLGNVNHGIELQDGDGVEIGGDPGAGEGNTIANNGADGVRAGLASLDNPIVGNEIFDNGGLGIDLEELGSVFGLTANDFEDADAGANDLQNFVDLAMVAETNSIRLIGGLQTSGAGDFRVEVFTNPSPHLMGFGDGEQLVDSFEVSSTSNAGVVVNETVNGTLDPGETLSVTATELTGPGGDPVQTSEFSPPLQHGYCDASDPLSSSALLAAAIVGTPGNDPSLDGTAGDDVICGLAGADTIDGGGGNDLIIGGPGTDAVDMSAATGPTQVNLAAETAAGLGSDRVTGVENPLGSAFPDTFTGDGGANDLSGAGGNDTLTGGAGSDILRGGADNDTHKSQDGGVADTNECGPGNRQRRGRRPGHQRRLRDGHQSGCRPARWTAYPNPDPNTHPDPDRD